MSEEVQFTSTPKRRVKKSNGAESILSESVKESAKKSTTTTGLPKDFNSVGLSYRFIRVFSWVVLVMFAIGFTVDMSGLRKDWDMPAGIWGLMTLVAGGAFVAQAIKEKRE